MPAEGRTEAEGVFASRVLRRRRRYNGNGGECIVRNFMICTHYVTKGRVSLWNACYHSAKSLLPSSLLSKNTNIKIYNAIILPVVSCGCETWCLTLREKHCSRIGC
jgi:hypothetical protein